MRQPKSKAKRTPKAEVETPTVNKPAEGLVRVCIHIPAASADIMAKEISQIRHFDAASTCILRLFDKEALGALFAELKAKDNEMNASIEAIARECRIIL